MFRINITLSLLFFAAHQVAAAAQFAPQPPFQRAAIIGEDNRQPRTPSDFSANVEAAQGRLWCHKAGPKPKGDRLKKSQLSLKNFALGNATLAFEDGVAIINRHAFLDDNGKKKRDFSDCFIEHIASGEIIRIVDGVYPERQSGDQTAIHFQDFAVVQLAAAPKGGMPIKREDIEINARISTKEQLKVVSNAADNNRDGNNLALTMTTCRSYGRYTMNGKRVQVHGTDCDTGNGSSGAQVYTNRGDGPKFSGIITGDIVAVPEGGEFDATNLSTIMTEFDDSLIESYETLKSRRGI